MGISRGEGRRCQRSVGSDCRIWMLRGRMPGSEVDALMKEDRQRRTRYAKEIGKPGEYSVHRYRPLCIRRSYQWGYVNAK